MKFLIIGSGGREHSICNFIKNSPKTKEIFCSPGNAGTELISQNIDLDLNNFEEIKNFIKKKKIDITIIGPEKPLVEGLVDYLEKYKIKVFGPNKISAQLEGSKIFTKNLCKDYNIPTAKFAILKTLGSAIDYINKSEFPIVIKADGLAAGKGVYICENKFQAIEASREIFNGKFGKSENVLIEEFLSGEEMSFFIISDSKNFKILGTAQDHKRVKEGDLGKNTGGMGAYSPSRLESEELNQKIINKIIKPTLEGLKKMGTTYKGFLYAGLMIVKNEPYLIEYNVRMGDPECQTILPRLKTDLVSIINSVINEKLDQTHVEWHDKKSLCIVLCSNGYPDSYQNEVVIPDLDKQKLVDGEFIFHAGTKKIDNKIFSNGGRVLNFVICSNNFKDSRKKAIDIIKKLNWKNGFFRKDIGFKVIDS